MLVTVVLVVLIIGFMAVTVFSLAAMLVVRRREKKLEDEREIGKTVEELDAALDAALKEINRLGSLIQTEIDEKYKAMLFLYNLVDDKKKEIEESADSEVISDMMEKYIETHKDKLRLISGMPEEAPPIVTAPPEDDTPDEPTEKKPKKITNPRHKQIYDMREEGKAPAEIAKELSMGQGEVKLILDLIDRAE
ncbi:MAG: DUF6115 domain-containing protein [Defluviitaleaceae bacterium]|nr:DUF6115 domain-containing protein [Defluviitaleaceae bacterium]